MSKISVVKHGVVEYSEMSEVMRELQKQRIGDLIPDTLIFVEHPEVVTQLHREFIRSGSDVIQAFTYYGHREKLRLIGKEDLLEPLQKNAL